jgi:hypothetical protein
MCGYFEIFEDFELEDNFIIGGVLGYFEEESEEEQNGYDSNDHTDEEEIDPYEDGAP